MQEKNLKLKVIFEDDHSELFHVRVRFSKRRSISMRLSSHKELAVSAPLGLPLNDIIRFIESRHQWLEKQLDKPEVEEQKFAEGEEEMLKKLSLQRAQAFLDGYEGPKPERISIRKQKSRWGSYSSSGTLSINLNAGLLEESLFEYLMIHELCHIIELNHGPAFWSLVEARIPDYKERRKKLKAIILKQ